MPIVYNAVTRPTNLTGLQNGKLPVTVLSPVFFPGYGHRSIHKQAARSWNAMAVAMLADPNVQKALGGKLLTVTPGGAYRTYAAQEAAFRNRMTDVYNELTCTQITRQWLGKTWWLKKGFSPVATPGTSNHGWGLALDLALWDGVRFSGITTNRVVWEWIIANYESFGFSHEGARPGQPGYEPWHIRLTTGDKTPARVLAIEQFLAAQKPA